MGTKKYRVKLSADERKKVERYLNVKKNSHESKVWGKILLVLDENIQEKVPSKPQVAKKLKICQETVSKVVKKYCEQGLEIALARKKRENHPVPSIVTGEIEAHIIQICCSEPPEGRSCWTMQMIANKIILDGVIETISDETVRKVLKKRNYNHIEKYSGASRLSKTQHS